MTSPDDTAITAPHAGPVALAELRVIMPALFIDRAYPLRYSAEQMLPLLCEAMLLGEILTRLRICHFLAQLAHESIELTHWEELPWTDKVSGKRYPECYEGRADLGNSESGDGRRFHGRGPIQLTGRGNYRHFGRALGLPLEQHPELALARDVGFRIAAQFWTEHHGNELADLDDIETITRRINGGLNGLESRRMYLARAQSAYAARAST